MTYSKHILYLMITNVGFTVFEPEQVISKMNV